MLKSHQKRVKTREGIEVPVLIVVIGKEVIVGTVVKALRSVQDTLLRNMIQHRKANQKVQNIHIANINHIHQTTLSQSVLDHILVLDTGQDLMPIQKDQNAQSDQVHTRVQNRGQDLGVDQIKNVLDIQDLVRVPGADQNQQAALINLSVQDVQDHGIQQGI